MSFHESKEKIDDVVSSFMESFLSIAEKEYDCLSKYCNAYNQLSHSIINTNSDSLNNGSMKHQSDTHERTDAMTAMRSFYDARVNLHNVHSQLSTMKLSETKEIIQDMTIKQKNKLAAIVYHCQLSERCIATCCAGIILDEMGFLPTASEANQQVEDYQEQIVSLSAYNAGLVKLRRILVVKKDPKDK